MATDEGEEDYVFYGTPLEREEDLAPNKRKQFLDKGQAKTVPPWQQEVLDENGRQRFHGAFTGGFSAGYFNTAGSKEGWAPKSFSSSRKKRADVSQQTAYDFMDEDEKAEVDSKELAASSEFDTFGFTAAEIARHRAAQELAKRPSAIPGLPPDEIIVPVSESIGVKLLLKMGWRHGRAIGPRQMAAAPEIIREGRKAMLALAQSQEGQILEEKAHGAQMLLGSHHKPNGHEEDADIIVPSSTPVYVINPKNNLFGLGFDPYKNAPEFQERKRLRLDDATHQKTKSSKIRKRDLLSKPSLFRPNAGKMGSGFGIGALEEMDEEDEDVYAQVAEIEVAAVEEEEVQPSSPKIQHKVLSIDHKQAALPGFKRASISKCQVEWFVSPVVPPGFVAVHKFSTPLHFESALLCPAPAEMPPPEDPELRKIIDGMATFVARSGKNFEDLSREKNTANPSFQFLSGGYGYDYYKRRLWEEQRKVLEQGKEQILKPNRSKAAALDSDQRGKILGEIPLDRKSLPATPAIAPEDHARLQSALSSTFTKSTSEAVDGSSRFQLFTYDAAKQARFEQFLKDKFQGGLRTADTITRNSLTELERAQESLEFEAASCDFEKAQVLTGAVCSAVELATLMGDRFTSESRDKAKYEEALSAITDKYPKREEQPWRPSSLLCKRFNLLDPYAGKPPPLPKPRSRTESFILLNNPVKSTVELPLIAANQSFSVSTKVAEDLTTFEEQKVGTSSSVMDDSGIQTPVEAIVEKPVDLYKAIFSDESEDEDEKTEMEIRQDKGAEAAQAALNRLEAGDFLRSLGEELGLKVPPAESAYVRKTKQCYFPKEASTDGKEKIVGAQKTKKLDDWDQPFEVGSVRNSSIIHTNFPDTDAKGGENIIQAEGIGIVQQTADNMVTGSKELMVKLDRKEEGKDSDKGKGSSKQKFSSEENSSEDEIDPHRNQRSKRESKSSKKKKRDSRRHKQKRDESHRKHLDRQKDRGKEQRHRHKHHYQHSRKHQRLSNNSSLSSTSTS